MQTRAVVPEIRLGCHAYIFVSAYPHSHITQHIPTHHSANPWHVHMQVWFLYKATDVYDPAKEQLLLLQQHGSAALTAHQAHGPGKGGHHASSHPGLSASTAPTAVMQA